MFWNIASGLVLCSISKHCFHFVVLYEKKDNEIYIIIFVTYFEINKNNLHYNYYCKGSGACFYLKRIVCFVIWAFFIDGIEKKILFTRVISHKSSLIWMCGFKWKTLNEMDSELKVRSDKLWGLLGCSKYKSNTITFTLIGCTIMI
jgi:hypothetical protein